MNTYDVNISGIFECTKSFEAATENEALAQARKYFETQNIFIYNIDHVTVTIRKPVETYRPVRDLFSQQQQQQSNYTPLNRI